jgi:hypothetical protein
MRPTAARLAAPLRAVGAMARPTAACLAVPLRAAGVRAQPTAARLIARGRGRRR